MSTSFDPVAYEKAALKLMREKKFTEAANIFRDLVQQVPNWESGGGAFNLAFCLEEIGNPEEALKYYELALSFDPGNDIFSWNYDSLKKFIASRR